MIQLLIEALFVGAMTAAGLLVAIRMFGAPTTTKEIVLLGFLLGMVIHFACEFTGLNRMYCSVGHACRAA